MEKHDCDESQTLFEIHGERSLNFHHFFVKTLSQQKHAALQSTAPLQLKCLKAGSKMVIAASAPVLANQKNTVLQKSPDSLTHPVHYSAYLQHNLPLNTNYM